MTTETRLVGRPAAAGFYAGNLIFVGATDGPRRRPSGEVQTEAAALRDAVAAALADALALAAAAEGEAADMIGFQAAMLEDPELVRSALVAIADGTPADSAWNAAMAAEIAEYAAAEQEYFRARTADLRDIRDAVLAKLRPGGVREVQATGVIVADDLPLSRFLAIDFSGGGAIVLTAGSRTSHVAMLARARLVPMIVGLGEVPERLAGRFALVDGVAGEVIVDPTEATRVRFAARREAGEKAADAGKRSLTAPARTADGTLVAMHLNIMGADELARLDPAICDGVGLFRTEFLFHGKNALPDEDAQYAIYRRVVEWAQGRPVTIRTLDAGGDKPLAGITAAHESNPFLGLRGLRLSLRHPGLFAVQLRALLRAARHGEVRIMLPMVTVPEELEAARVLLEAEIAAFARAGEAVPRPKLGIMVEVPAAAITIERFDAAFFSIGSNDLTQYVTAAGRDMEDVAELADPTNPAVIRLIEAVVRHGRQSGRDVSLCGDAGGDPAVVPALLAAGLRSLSVAPELLAGAKQAVAAAALPR